MEAVNQRFGRLVVIAKAERKGYVKCLCDCGNVKDIRATSLTKRFQPTRSCGCLQRESATEVGKSTIGRNSQNFLKDSVTFNTNFHTIESTHVPKNNKSGEKGIWFNRERGLWEAYISVHGKKIYLGRYGGKEQAIQARKAAEAQYFTPLIESKNQAKGGVPDGNEGKQG